AGQRLSTLRRRLDRLDCPRQLGIEQALEGLGVAADDHQEIVEIVRDAAGELADRLHFLGHRQLLARLDELLLGVAALGRIAQDARESDQVALPAANNRDHAGYEERRSILADTPAL